MATIDHDHDLAQCIDDLTRHLDQVPTHFMDACLRDAEIEHDPPDSAMSYLSDGYRRMFGCLGTIWAMARVCRDAITLREMFAQGDEPVRISVRPETLLTMAQRSRHATLLEVRAKFIALDLMASWEPEGALEIVDKMMETHPDVTETPDG